MKAKYLFFSALIPAALAVSAYIYRNSFHADNLFLIEGVAFTCGVICALAYLASPKNNRAVLLLTAAFIFSIMGDFYFRKHDANSGLIMGGFFFLLAHIGFSIYCLTKVKFSWFIFAVIAIPYVIWYFTVLMPSDRLRSGGFLAFAVFLYLIASCFSFSVSIDLKNGSIASWIFTAGIACILVSDSFIAARSFLDNRRFAFLIMPLYYLCHILIALSVTLRPAPGIRR